MRAVMYFLLDLLSFFARAREWTPSSFPIPLSLPPPPIPNRCLSPAFDAPTFRRSDVQTFHSPIPPPCLHGVPKGPSKGSSRPNLCLLFFSSLTTVRRPAQTLSGRCPPFLHVL